MNNKTLTIIIAVITFTNTTFAQYPSTSSDLWFEIIGREYSSVNGTAMKIKNLEGNFYINDNGVLYQLVKTSSSIRIGGFMFISPEVFKNSLASNTDAGFYDSPLPLNLEWGMSMDAVKKILPAINISDNNQSGKRLGVIYDLPGFPNLNAEFAFTQNRLTKLYLLWKGVSDISNTFWHPKGLYSYDLKGAMEDLAITKDALDVNNMHTYLNAYFNRGSNQIPGLVGFNTNYEEQDGVIRMSNTYCTNDLNFKYSFYNRLQNKLNLLLSDCIVKPSEPSYEMFEPYYAVIVHDDFDNKNGETFYVHKEDADDFKEKNKWPIFHLYTTYGTNEVVFEVIPPSVDASGDASSLSHISGDGWFKYFFKNHKSPEVQKLLNYLTEVEGASYDRLDNDKATTYEVYKLGIAFSLYPKDYTRKNKIKKMEAIWFYSKYNTDNAGNFLGKLPLGFSFNQSYEELKKQASSIDKYSQNTLTIIKHGIIECNVRFDDKGRIEYFLFEPKIYNEQLFDQTLESLGINYLETPEPGASEEKNNRFETKFQKVCTPDDQSLVLDRDEYIKSLNLDLSSKLNPVVANIQGGDILSIIGRPTEGELAKSVIKKLGDFTVNQSFDFFGTLDVDNIIIAYNNDSTFKDLKVIAYIEFRYDKISFAPLGISNKMKESKIEKMLSTDDWRKVKDAGYSLAFRYKKGRLYSITISLK